MLSDFGGMANNKPFFFLLLKSEAVESEITGDTKTSSSKKGFIVSHTEEKKQFKGPSSQGFYKICELTLKKKKKAYFMLTFVMSLNLDISWQLLKLYDIIPGN